MALQAAYKQFIAAPNPSFLAQDASLHYITTLVTLNGSAEIVKHLNRQRHDMTKKEELFLNVVEGPKSIAVEAHTTIEFLTGGGSYLPSLDDNFLADRVVTFPIIHIVTFDANGLIQQIRQSWDQGSLLKLIDVIGKTGRNWPICDGKDQIKLIANSVKSAGGSGPAGSKEQLPNRSRENSTNVTRDPHASLSLFAAREQTVIESLPTVAAPRASAKPPPRNYHDLFVGNDSDSSPVPASKGINIAGDGMGSRKVPQSDSSAKPAAIAPKGGAGKNYAPSRLFDHHTEADDESTPKRPPPEKDHSAEHFYTPHAKKYQHFDFADGSDSQDAPVPTPMKDTKNKHSSQWGMEDFSTPAQHIPTKGLRTNDVRHWGNSDDEVVDSPVKPKKVDKPRKDAEPHFEFKDDGTPAATRVVGRPRGAGGNSGMALYKNNLYDDEQGGEIGGSEQKQVNTIANTKDRRKDFDPHFAMTDDSPASKPQQGLVGEDRQKAVKMMDAQWGTYDKSPAQKENVSAPRPASPTTTAKGINIAGDGMGSRKTQNPLAETTNRNKGISVGGDGMGGKKGAGRQWGFGDDSEEETTAKPAYRTGKQQGKNQATGGDFWDF